MDHFAQDSADGSLFKVTLYRLRRWLSFNSTLVTSASIVLLVAALITTMAHLEPAKPLPGTQDYFYDLNTGQLFTDERTYIPPIEAPSGPLIENGVLTDKPAGVRAYVYSCSNCENRASRFIAYLETFSDHANALLSDRESVIPRGMTGREAAEYEEQVFNRGHMFGRIAKDRSVQWAPAFSEEGLDIEVEAFDRCVTGKGPVPCFPHM